MAKASTLGDRLQRLRVTAQQTQDQVGDAVGVNSGTVSRWERDEGKPHADQIVRLAHHFGVTTDHILLGHPIEAQVKSAEFHRFLATDLGRIARERGWVQMLLTMNYPKPPTVRTYKAIVNGLLLGDDDDE